jgi:uncharacterized protein (TIGR00369 family)
MRESKISTEQFHSIVDEGLPQGAALNIEVEELNWGYASVILPFQNQFLRPGGTISGPTMMTLGDLGLYLAVLSVVGPVPMAVTTNLNANFLNFPKAGDMRAVTKILKAGRRLVYGTVDIYALAGDPDLCVTHISGTYSVPPPEKR